jgi:hypothetical protein
MTPEHYGRAALRWVGRFALEARTVTLSEVRTAADALARLPDDADGSMATLERYASLTGSRSEGQQDRLLQAPTRTPCAFYLQIKPRHTAVPHDEHKALGSPEAPQPGNFWGHLAAPESREKPLKHWSVGRPGALQSRLRRFDSGRRLLCPWPRGVAAARHR